MEQETLENIAVKPLSKVVAAKFEKTALAKCGKWKADIVNAFLEDGKQYSIAEATKIINKKLKGEM